MTAEQECAAWNEMNPVGTDVHVKRQGEGLFSTRTRTEAYVSVSGHAVIFVENVSGFMRLNFVTRRVPG